MTRTARRSASQGPTPCGRCGILFCVGAVLAPPISGAAIDWFGPNGLPFSLAVMILLVLPLPLIGMLRKWPA